MLARLEELERIAKEKHEAFLFAKPGEKLAPLYEAKEKAQKDAREYRAQLYKGSGVNGNEIPTW